MESLQTVVQPAIRAIEAQNNVEQRQNVDNLLATTNALFQRRDSGSQRTPRIKKRGRKYQDKADLLCVLLDNKRYLKVPDKSVLNRLSSKGLGQRSISISRSSSADDIEDVVRSAYPLLNGYSFDFMKSTAGRKLVSLPTFTTGQDLKSSLKKGKLYIIPKRDLTHTVVSTDVEETDTDSLPDIVEFDHGAAVEQENTPRRHERIEPIRQSQNENIQVPVTETVVAGSSRNEDVQMSDDDFVPENTNRIRQRRPVRNAAIRAVSIIHEALEAADENQLTETVEVHNSRQNQSRQTTGNARAAIVDLTHDLAEPPTIQLSSTPTPQFEETSSPSVQFRSMPEEPVARTIFDIPTGDVVQLDDTIPTEEVPLTSISDFIPFVPPSHQTSSTPSIDLLKEAITGHAGNFISPDQENPFIMAVRREFVLVDSLNLIRASGLDLHNPLKISFLGEDGIDLGGLRREFWSIFLHQLSKSVYLTGCSGRQTLRRDFVEVKKNTFFYIGQLVALSILQDGPGVPLFSEVSTDHIIEGKTTNICESDLGDLAEILRKMENATSDEELREAYFDIIDAAAAAGFNIPITKIKKEHIPVLKAALVEDQVSLNTKEMDQFKDGLDTHGVLTFLSRSEHKINARGLFSGKMKPVTANALKELMVFRYSDGNIKQKEMATVMGFITFLQATKGGEATVNGITLTPKDVLMWLTGSTHIPAIGFHKKVDVDFGESIKVNTCALGLTLKTNELSGEDAVKYYTDMIINSQTFTVE